MVTRREFLKTVGAGVAGMSTTIRALESRRQFSGYFGVHPFVDEHPEAVFVMRTNVDQKMNAEAKLEAGLTFGRSVFVARDESGVPLTMSIPVKPNMKTADPVKYPMEEIIGHVADPYFVEGTLMAIKELGVSGCQFHLREVNGPEIFGGPFGFSDVADRLGADIRLDLAPTVDKLVEGRDYNFVDIPNGIFYKKIPFLEPINVPDTWLLNIAKFKAHGMGLTLCCKNLQGSIAHNYQQFCSAFDANMSISAVHRQADAKQVIRANWQRHRDAGVPRWDRPGTDYNSGLGMETWVTRTLDNLSVTPCGLHIIEGIYGRDGQGNGVYGPNPQDQNHNIDEYGRSNTGKAWDWMSNIIIFGRDPFRVDIIGHWLGGHEPGNFGLFHCAIDRGMSDALDPRQIPVYTWADGTATLTPLESLERTPLLTYYLPRTYDGQNESPYHLCDEPFDYGSVTGIARTVKSNRPDAFVLHQNRPNPFNPYTTIEYSLVQSGYARIEIYNSRGQLIDVPVDRYHSAGIHMTTWNAGNRPTGTYFYRFMIPGYSITKKMTLVR